MIVYIDTNFKCHTQNDGTMLAVDAPFFDGKCAEYIGGYIFVPAGETYTRDDGTKFRGEIAVPWKDHALLRAYQQQYEIDQEALSAAYREGVNSV